MYNIEFYQTSTGYCDIFEFLDDLRVKASVSKDSTT